MSLKKYAAKKMGSKLSDSSYDKAKKAGDSDFWVEETVIKGDPLGPTSIREVEKCEDCGKSEKNCKC